MNRTFTHKSRTLLKGLVLFMLFIGSFSVSFKANAQANITANINWPSWAGENVFDIYDPNGVYIGGGCWPSNCYNGASGAYSATNVSIVTSPKCGTYTVYLYDYYGDGWNSGGSITLYNYGVSIGTLSLSSGSSAGFTFTIGTQTTCTVGAESAGYTAASGCSDGSIPLGSGAYKDITVAANTYYNFSWANNSGGTTNGFCATPLNGSGSAFSTNQTGWFSGSTTTLRVGALRSSCTWSATSAVMTYRHTQPTASISPGTNVSTCNGATTLTGTAGYGTGTWSKTAGSGSVTSGGAVSGVTAGSNGTFQYSVNNNGCSASASRVVYNYTPTASASNTGAYCPGNTISVTTTAVSGATYAWSGPGGWTASTQSPTRTGATTAMSGTYTVTVTLNGCTATSSTTVTVNATPAASASNTGAYCPGNTISVTTTAVSGATYAWSGPGGWTASTQTATRTGATTAMSGTYTVTVTLNGCTATSSTTVTVNAATAGGSLSGGPTIPSICLGASTGTITLSSHTGGVVRWEKRVNGGSWSNIVTTSTTYSENPSSTGTWEYRALVQNSSCPTAYSSSYSILVYSLPAATASNDGPVCSGGAINLSVSGLAPAGKAANLTGTQVINGNFVTGAVNNFTMEFWVKPTATRPTTTESNTGTVGTSSQRYAIFPSNASANAGAGVSVGTNGISVFEHGSSYMPSNLVYDFPATVTDWMHVAVVYNNRTPSLYINGVFIKTGVQSARTTVYASTGTGNSYGYYAGQIDNIRIWSTQRTQTEIVDNMLLNQPVSTTGLVVAYDFDASNTNASFGSPNNSNGGATFVSPNYFTYTWAGSGTITPNNTTAETSSATAPTGSYSVTYVAPGGCSASASASTTVTVSAQPTISLTSGNNQSICTGTNASAFTASISGGVSCTYQWQSSNDGVSWTDISGATSASYTPTGVTQSTFYRARTNNCNGSCTQATSQVRFVAVTAVATVQTHPTPTSQTVCAGSDITYTSQANIGSGTTRYRVVFTSAHGSAWHGLQEILGYNTAGVQQTLSCLGASSATYTDDQCNGTSYGASNAFDGVYNSATSNGLQWLTPEYNNATGTSGNTLPNYNWENYTTYNPFYSPEWIEFSSPQPLAEIWIYNGRYASGTLSTCFKDFYIMVSYNSGTTWSKVKEGTMNMVNGFDGNNNKFVIEPDYTWKRGTTTVGTGKQLDMTAVTTANTGSYTVQMTYGCATTTSNTASLTVVNDPTFSTPSFTSSSICTGGSTSVSSTISGGTGTPIYQWQYYNGSTWVNVANGTPAGATYTNSTTNNMTIAGITAAGSYQYRITTNNAQDCNGQSTGATLTVNTPSTANAAGPNTVCQSSSPTAITLSGASVGGGATTGAWSIISGGGTLSSTAQTSNPAAVTYTPAANFSGTVTLRLTSNAASGCSAATNDRTINVTALPAVAASNTGPYCIGNTISLTTTAVSGATYSWSGPGGWTASTQSPTRTNATAAMNGVYTVTVTANSCSATSSTTVVISQPSSVTINDSIAPNTVAAGDYLWVGRTNSQWSNATNWYEYDGSDFAPAATAPGASDNVYLVSNAASGCITTTNPQVNTASSVKDIYIGTSRALTFASGQRLNVYGDYNNSKGAITNSGTSTIAFVGSGSQTVTAGGTGSSPNKRFNYVILDKPSGSVVQASTAYIGADITFTNGIWDNTSGNYAITVLGNWDNGGSAQFLPGTSTVTVSNSASKQIITGYTTGSPTGKTFHNFTKSGAGGVDLVGDLRGTGALSFSAGTVNSNSNTISFGTTISIAGTLVDNAGTIFAGTSATVTGTFTGTNSSFTSGSTFTIGSSTVNTNFSCSNCVVASGTSDFAIGVANVNGFMPNVTLTNGGTLTAGRDMLMRKGTLDAGSATLYITRHWNNTGASFTYGTSTVRFVGTASSNITSLGQSFYKVYLERDVASRTTTALDDLTIVDELQVVTGTLVINQDVLGTAKSANINTTGRMTLKQVSTGTSGGEFRVEP